MWRTVFKKELQDVLRDKRTLFNLVLSPLLITPILLLLMSRFGKNEAKDAATRPITVGVVGLAMAPTVEAELKGLKSEKVTLESVATEEEAQARVRSHKLPAAMVFAEDAEERFKNTESVPVTVLVDMGNRDSLETSSRLKSLFQEQGERIVAVRLVENGLSQQLAKPFEVGQKQIKGGGGEGMIMMAIFLPYILTLAALIGGAFVAFDSVAGEKERGTLETLLVSPVPRRQLVTGKFCTVVAVSLAYGVLTVIGLLWPHYIPLKLFQEVGGKLSFTPVAILSLFLVQIPLAVLGSGLLLTISTVSRNQKETQTYMPQLMTVVSIFSMLSLFVKAESGLALALVPILNAALVLKQALTGATNLTFVAVACAASLVYALAAVFFAAQLFNKEAVLLKA